MFRHLLVPTDGSPLSAKAAQAEAVLAAVAAGWALGLAPELIGAGLRTFDSTPKKER